MQKENKKPLMRSSWRNGKIVAEMVFDSARNATGFCIKDDDGVRLERKIKLSTGEILMPYPANHSYIKDRVILFPSSADDFGNVQKLAKSIQAYIRKYVDLSEEFELIATHYVLLSWLYDKHNVLGYLRIKGDFGTGKTRFLTIMGSICYKPIFASGAATVAPLFHILNDIGGTLIMDESDFFNSSEKSQIAKILNNGNAKGFPVLRCQKNRDQSFSTRSFSVYGPKILASRGRFDDDALESRFLTENAGVRQIRADIPLHIGESQEKEALKLRNQLLAFRLEFYSKEVVNISVKKAVISPRMQQVLSPLLKFITEEERRRVIAWGTRQQNQQSHDRGMELAGHILFVLQKLKRLPSIEIGRIRKEVIEQFGDHYEFQPTAKKIGSVIRNDLQLNTRRIRGRYLVTQSEIEKVELLSKRYGVNIST